MIVLQRVSSLIKPAVSPAVPYRDNWCMVQP